MKRTLALALLVLFIVSAVPAFAREQTLISGHVDHGGFGGMSLKFTEFDDQFALLIGGKGGWIVNHSIVLGGAGYGLVTNVDAPSSRYYLNVGYGGGIMEFVVASDRLFHLSAGVLIGGGAITYRDWDYEIIRHTEDAFFVLEPGADLVLNVAPGFRIGLGVSYRFMHDVDLFGLTDDSMSGPSASLTLKFGHF